MGKVTVTAKVKTPKVSKATKKKVEALFDVENFDFSEQHRNLISTIIKSLSVKDTTTAIGVWSDYFRTSYPNVHEYAVSDRLWDHYYDLDKQIRKITPRLSVRVKKSKK